MVGGETSWLRGVETRGEACPGCPILYPGCGWPRWSLWNWTRWGRGDREEKYQDAYGGGGTAHYGGTTTRTNGYDEAIAAPAAIPITAPYGQGRLWGAGGWLEA
jgi:hypothetical protein